MSTLAEILMYIFITGLGMAFVSWVYDNYR